MPGSAQTGSILVVDDDPGASEILSLWLRKRGHRVHCAPDAGSAMTVVEREPIELVLLDVMMPGIDGFTLLTDLRRRASRVKLPVIMVTALGESEHVVRALELGANDYVAKPLDFPVVLARVETQLALRRASAELEEEHERVRRDLRAAAGVQHSLLPHEPPAVEGVRCAWAYRPCQEVGGDCFNLLVTRGGLLAFYMLDVSGHGVQAALTAAGLARVLASIAGTESLAVGPERGEGHAPDVPAGTPAEVAARLNRHFCAAPSGQQFATLFYGVLDPRRRRLRYVSAGHPWPVRVPPDAPATFVETDGFPIGWFEDPGYTDAALGLAAGERLYLISDGVSEARDETGRQFGPARLRGCLEGLRGQPLEESVNGLIAAAEAWRGRGDGEDDDISVVALEMRE